jgi:hypothetical protein
MDALPDINGRERHLPRSPAGLHRMHDDETRCFEN